MASTAVTGGIVAKTSQSAAVKSMAPARSAMPRRGPPARHNDVAHRPPPGDRRADSAQQGAANVPLKLIGDKAVAGAHDVDQFDLFAVNRTPARTAKDITAAVAMEANSSTAAPTAAMVVVGADILEPTPVVVDDGARHDLAWAPLQHARRERRVGGEADVDQAGEGQTGRHLGAQPGRQQGDRARRVEGDRAGDARHPRQLLQRQFLALIVAGAVVGLAHWWNAHGHDAGQLPLPAAFDTLSGQRGGHRQRR